MRLTSMPCVGPGDRAVRRAEGRLCKRSIEAQKSRMGYMGSFDQLGGAPFLLHVGFKIPYSFAHLARRSRAKHRETRADSCGWRTY